MADCNTMGDIIKQLVTATTAVPVTTDGKKRIVVIDAGIATEANLKTITEMEYDYVCVSRSSLMKYTVAEGASPIVVYDRLKRPISLVKVQNQKAEANGNTYYLKVTSPSKALKEKSMHKQFCVRFEEGLEQIIKGIASKGGTKKYNRVNQRIGRLAQKYPSVHNLYEVTLEKNEKDVCTSMTWMKKPRAIIERQNACGVYFLHTSIEAATETLVWTVYNCIREIESTFRCLKSDIDLRPIFHKTDEASKAHLHLGLMAYWVVNTIRFQLKGKGTTSDWRELVRVMNTQKCVTTGLYNDKGQHISIRCCSKPEPKLALLYDALQMKNAPFIRKKSVVLKIEPATSEKFDLQADTN